MKPNFLFVGAAKCGSTWFFKALQAHPQVYVPQAKDIYYFDKQYGRGSRWYESFFDGSKGALAVGEVSHDYLYSRKALERIHSDLPDVKIIACVREPIKRAFSAYLFMRRNGTAGSNFRETLEGNPVIMERGKYTNYLQHCSDVFGRENVKVFLFDELQNEPVYLARELYAFLGVDADFSYEDAKKKVLPASQARLQLLASMVKHCARVVRGLGYPGLVGSIKDSWLPRMIYRPISGQKEAISDEDKVWMVDYYKEDVHGLERWLGKSLKGWLK